MDRKHSLQSFVILFILALSFIPLSLASEKNQAVIYYNEACHHCSMYIDNELVPVFDGFGIEVVRKDFINHREYRKELNDLNEQMQIPFELQGHFTIFVGEKIILEGHVPVHVIRDILNDPGTGYDRIIVFQDEMSEDAESYRIWAYKGEIKEYPIKTPVRVYLDWFGENKLELEEPEDIQTSVDLSSLLPLVLVTGLIDGINPCAFAVILFLIAFLFTIRKSRGSIFKTGLVYISAIFMVYFLIGVGLLQAIHIFNIPHFMARFGAYLIIVLGIVNLIGYFFPKFPIKLRMPTMSKGRIQSLIHKSTLPSAFVLGVLVGLCVFPCSGAIYVAIIGMLSVQATFSQTIFYLLVYNVMFVLPLLIILAVTGNRRVTEKFTDWEQSQSGKMKLFAGIFMIALGLVFLIWFV